MDEGGSSQTSWAFGHVAESATNRLILQSLAVFGVNIVVGSLATLTAWLLLVRNDVVLAAIAGFIALPGIIPQPWYIAFFFFPLVAPSSHRSLRQS
jgi:hypothetical protein